MTVVIAKVIKHLLLGALIVGAIYVMFVGIEAGGRASQVAEVIDGFVAARQCEASYPGQTPQCIKARYDAETTLDMLVIFWSSTPQGFDWLAAKTACERFGAVTSPLCAYARGMS